MPQAIATELCSSKFLGLSGSPRRQGLLVTELAKENSLSNPLTLSQVPLVLMGPM
jgi:hypothetical protein